MGVAISGLVAASEVGEADVFEIEQSGISKKLTKTQLRSLLFSDPAFSVALPQAGDSLTYNGTDWVPGARGKWRTVPVEAYTESAPASTSTITFAGGAAVDGVNLRGGDYFSVGDPVRVLISGVNYYGICTAITDTLLTMSGMILPLSAITSLAVGSREMIKHVDLSYGYSASTTSVYTGFGASVAIPRGMSHRWRGATGYLVAASAAHSNTSSSTVINFKMNAGTNVLTSGLTPAAGTAGPPVTQGAFVDSALGDIIAANAVIADGQTITTVCTTVGGTAESLVACLTFIVP